MTEPSHYDHFQGRYGNSFKNTDSGGNLRVKKIPLKVFFSGVLIFGLWDEALAFLTQSYIYGMFIGKILKMQKLFSNMVF